MKAVTDKEIKREQNFIDRIAFFKKRAKEFFADYENPSGSEDRLEICLIRDGWRAVSQAEEIINRIINDKNAEIERFNVRYEKLLKAKEQIEVETSQEVQSLHREIKTQSKALLAYKEEFERYQSGAYIKLAKAEAVKEFAERLKENSKFHYDYEANLAIDYVETAIIDNLLKEMAGDTK